MKTKTICLILVLAMCFLLISPASAAIKACLACNQTCGGDTTQFPWLNGTRTLTGIWDFGGYNISDVGEPMALQDALTLNYFNTHSGGGSGDLSQYLPLNGTSAMTGNLSMGTYWINNLGDPTDPQDAASMQYVLDHAVGGSGHDHNQLLNTTDPVQFANTTYYYEEPTGEGTFNNYTTSLSESGLKVVTGDDTMSSPWYALINSAGGYWANANYQINIDLDNGQIALYNLGTGAATIIYPDRTTISGAEVCTTANGFCGGNMENEYFTIWSDINDGSITTTDLVTSNATHITPDGITIAGENVCTDGNGLCGDPTACQGYPPGAVYGSTTGIDPATELGCGQWQNKTMLGDITFWERVLS